MTQAISPFYGNNINPKCWLIAHSAAYFRFFGTITTGMSAFFKTYSLTLPWNAFWSRLRLRVPMTIANAFSSLEESMIVWPAFLPGIDSTTPFNWNITTSESLESFVQLKYTQKQHGGLTPIYLNWVCKKYVRIRDFICCVNSTQLLNTIHATFKYFDSICQFYSTPLFYVLWNTRTLWV